MSHNLHFCIRIIWKVSTR